MYRSHLIPELREKKRQKITEIKMGKKKMRKESKGGKGSRFCNIGNV